jgi:hypothetical protein
MHLTEGLRNLETKKLPVGWNLFYGTTSPSGSVSVYASRIAGR